MDGRISGGGSWAEIEIQKDKLPSVASRARSRGKLVSFGRRAWDGNGICVEVQSGVSSLG